MFLGALVISSGLALLTFGGVSIARAEAVTVEQIPGGLPAATFVETDPPAPEGGLPDGRAARVAGTADIVEAWYTAPTSRYRHGALGDVIEGGALTVRTAKGDTLAYTLPENAVFEDRTPRLADLNGDGQMEVVTIISLADAGGSVAVFGLKDGQLVQKATSKPIGRSNRWLNIAGIADFAGLGRNQIAYVETPHIGGTLILLDWQGKRLKKIDSVRGFSNHRNGAREQRVSAVIDVDGDGRDDLAVPSDDWRTLRFMRIEGGKWAEHARLDLPGRIDPAIVPAKGPGGHTCWVVGLTTGGAIRLCPAR
jgi:hypothetical protein